MLDDLKVVVLAILAVFAKIATWLFGNGASNMLTIVAVCTSFLGMVYVWQGVRIRRKQLSEGDE